MKQEVIAADKKERVDQSKKTHELFVSDDGRDDTRFTGNYFKPYTVDNEIKAWAIIKAASLKYLKDYDTTVEEDVAILEKDDQA